MTKELEFHRATRQKLREELAGLAAKRAKLQEASAALLAAETARNSFEENEASGSLQPI